MKCCIVRDLLPGYIDGLTSSETNEEIERHLEECAACKTVYRQMTAMIPSELPTTNRDIDFLKKLKERIHQKYMTVALITCTVLIGSTVFLKNYQLPIAYDPDYMTTELYEIAYVPNQFGLREWQYKGSSDAQEPDAQEAKENGDDETMEMIRFVLNMPLEKQKSLKINNFISTGKTIQRNGKTVRVVYYCYTRTLWNSLFPDQDSFLNLSVSEGNVFEENFYRNPNTDYQPMQREIYYLPMSGLNRLDSLSDEEFDAQKKHAKLVWSGVL